MYLKFIQFRIGPWVFLEYHKGMSKTLNEKLTEMEACKFHNHDLTVLKQWDKEDFVPFDGQHAIHVAGTNGKGSVITWLEVLFKAQACQTRSFISPHLIRHNERFRINGQAITMQEWETIYDAFCDRFFTRRMTMFEMDLWMARQAFIHHQTSDPTWTMIETGLGGSQDATTALDYKYGIITQIGFDHMAFLGSTKAEIAQAKAGIIQPGMLVVTFEKDPDCLAVFQQRARSVHAKLKILNDSDLAQVDFSEFWNLHLPAYQKENFMCAYTLLNEIGYSFSCDQLKQAIQDFFWPARFQVLRQDPYLVLDGAHNPDGIEALVSSLMQSHTKIDQIYFSVLADKQAHVMIRRLQDLTNNLHFVSFESERLADLDQLAQEYNAPVVELDTLFQELATTSKTTLVCGSLYFAGYVLEHFLKL